MLIGGKSWRVRRKDVEMSETTKKSAKIGERRGISIIKGKVCNFIITDTIILIGEGGDLI